ncbi:unnamed protein product [Rotaria magnacalcarata]|uniref:Uncharacterized protein n=3 Tax=Rotaria magnacalcarata TaxID=392030 RepID=A0A816PUE6_9BILA|nr:unnamed protein product [Rotaria magnacalcarata]CAF4144732.1 unnamed protein product [Rotaria magnacalcarata]
MPKRTDWIKELNELDCLNVEFCETLTASYNLSDFFPDQPYLVKIFENYRSKKLNDLTLFWCVLISFMHWSSETKLYDKDKMEYINLKLYGILRGNSVSHKSGYIKPVREAFDFVERYYREQFIDNNNKFSTTCMESLTTAKLISELEMSSKFISSDEDRPLTDFAFFEPNSIKAKEIHPNLICGFNGVYKLQRSTVRQNNNIHDRSLTVLIPTTGDRWPQLLEHFYDAHQTNGLYERFLYWVISKKNFVEEKHDMNNNLPSLEYLFITRMEIGHRIYIYDEDTSAYLKPILSAMRSNQSCDEISTTIPSNKRAEACQRRSADLIERIAAIFQNLIDTVMVLQDIDSIDFHRIQKHTFEKIKANVNRNFYQQKDNSDSHTESGLYPDHIDLKDLPEVQIKSVLKSPLSSMKVTLSAAKAAVRFFNELLLPQSIKLFNTDTNVTKNNTINELKIIEYHVNCFSISDLTHNGVFHNHKRNKIDVKEVISNLEKNSFIKRGKYIKAGPRAIESWIKQLPDPSNDEQILCFQSELHYNYEITLKQYLDTYTKSIDCNSTALCQSGKELLETQRLWISLLKEKLNGFDFDLTFSNITNRCSTTNVMIKDSLLAKENDLYDILDCINYNPYDLPVLSFDQLDTVDKIQQNDVVIESTERQQSLISNKFDDQYLSSPRGSFSDQIQNDIVIHDILSDIITQVANSLNSITATNVTLVTKQQIVPIHNVNKISIVRNSLVSEGMKHLCKKILLVESVILSNTKLNRTCKTNMIDVHKACQILIDHGLLTVEDKMLANKSSYCDAYLKQVPQSAVDMIEFTLLLAQFGIYNLDTYYSTLKTVDTRNNTYVTPYGLSIFKAKPYANLEIIVNENDIIYPSTSNHRKLFSASTQITQLDDETSSSMECNETIDAEQPELTNSNRKSKRWRNLTNAGKEYQAQRSKSKKKKNALP